MGHSVHSKRFNPRLANQPRLWMVRRAFWSRVFDRGLE